MVWRIAEDSALLSEVEISGAAALQAMFSRLLLWVSMHFPKKTSTLHSFMENPPPTTVTRVLSTKGSAEGELPSMRGQF